MKNQRDESSEDDISSASTHLSWKLSEDDKSISAWSKLSDESEVKIDDSKLQKYWWIEV